MHFPATLLASRLLLRGSSKKQFYSSHLIVISTIYPRAKFGALNPRINENRSGGSWFQLVFQVQTCTFFIKTISGFLSLVTMFPLTHVQVDFGSKLKLRLKTEKFIKECMICFAVGKILRLTNSQLCILLCSLHRDPNIFWPKWIP
jgi:hypothetical protein